MVLSRNIRLLLALLIFLGLFGIVASIVSRSQPKASKTSPIEQKQLPEHVDISMDNARFSEMKDGVVTWEMVAEKAVYSKNNDLATLYGIKMTFAATKKAGKCIVTAKEGTFVSSSRNVTLSGNVHIESENGARFQTQQLKYNARNGIFTSNDLIKFNHERLSLISQGMELNVTTEKVHFFKPTNATIAGAK